MKILSTNLAKPVTIQINGRQVNTGIYKNSVQHPIFLGKYGIVDDSVADLSVHGGEDKACYIYPHEHYVYWKSFYPELEWQMGMFGENLTTEGLKELSVKIGAEYRIGEAIVQVSQPRQPCFKLGYKFGYNQMIKQFREAPFPGIYVRVLQEGYVKANDEIELLKENPDSVTVLDVYCLQMKQIENAELLEKALKDENLADSARKDLLKLKD